MILTGLEGVEGAVDAVMVHNATDVISCLKMGKAATMAGDNGAINVWCGDDGKFRCERHKYCITQSSEIFGTHDEVKAWVKTNRRAIR